MYFDRRLWSLTRGVRLQIALAVALGLGTAAAGIARLALLGWLLGRVFRGDTPADLVWPIAAVLLAVVLRGVLQYLKESIAYRTATRVQRVLRTRLYAHALALGPAYFDSQRSGGTAVSLVEGVEQLETFFGQYLPQLFTAALTPIGIFAFMVLLDVPTAVVYLVFALVTLVAPSIFHRANANASLRRRDAYSDFASDFLDSIQGLPTLKAFGQGRTRGEALEARAYEVFRTTMKVLASNSATHGLTVAGIAIGAAVALIVGAARVDSGDLSLEVLLVILMLGVEVFRPLRELSQLFHQGLMGIAAASSVFEVLDAEPTVRESPEPVEEVVLDGADAAIEFADVTFAYPGGRRPALRGVSLSLARGERVAVVGRSGSGKSTLVWLLQRLYDPQSGSVRIGGRDLRELSFGAIRRQMAVVTQDTYLFHGTIADNLRIGKPDASSEDMERAARLANAHDFIASMPAGYETLIGERGQRLSGGERQRLAIARALLRDAPILILDEALSSVDANNEAIIQDALNRLMEGRTTLVIAHRLSSILACDRIVVLQDGEVVEQGTHAGLAADGRAYPALVADQLDRSTPGDDVVLGEPQNGAHPEAPQRVDLLAVAHEDDAPSEAMRAAEQMGWGQTSMRLLRVVGPLWPKLVLSFVSGVGHFTGLIGISVLAALMVAQVRGGDPATGFMVALLILAPVTALLTWIESWVSHDLAFRLLAQMRIALYRKLDALAPGYLQRRRSGDLVAVATQDVETVEYFFAHTIANAFVALLVPAAIVVTLWFHGWMIALALLPFLVLAAWTPILTRRSVEDLGTRARDHLGGLNAHVIDTLQGLREIAAFELAPRRSREFDGLVAGYMPVRLAFNRQITLQRVLLEVLIGAGGLAVLVVGASRASAGDLDADRLPLLTLIAMGAFLPISELAQVGRRLGDTIGATRRLTAIELEPVPVMDGPGLPVEERDGSVALESVTFTYPGGRRPALSDVTIHLQSGTTLALVGPSGAGKSTVAALMLRFWDPQQGRVLVSGGDAREYRLDQLRSRIALVAQDTYLFNATIRENLLIARPDASDADLETALSRAGLADFIEALPDAVHTMVGERGMQLSGGQRQRVAIGRALLKDAPILILDEATSHLDSVNERGVRRALGELEHGRTTVVIAHRLSTVREADRIVVMDSGRVVESGTHDELIRAGGLYAQLVTRQRSGAATAV